MLRLTVSKTKKTVQIGQSRDSRQFVSSRGFLLSTYLSEPQISEFIYRVIQKERSIFCDVIVSVMLRKYLHMNIWIILNGCRDGAVWISDLNPLDFCLWCWTNSEVNKIKVDAPDWPLARSLGAAACIKKREDQLRRTTGDLHTPAAKCTEVDGGILEHLLRTVTDLLFKHWTKTKIK